MNVAAILLLLALAATRTNGAGIVELASAGSKFEDLPYAAWLSAGNNQINVSIEVGYVILYRGGTNSTGGSFGRTSSVSSSSFSFI